MNYEIYKKKLTTIAENEPKVFAAGKKSFWDTYLEPLRKGNETVNLFSGQGWNNKTFFPTENIIPKNNGMGMFLYFSWYVSPYIDLAERLKECGVYLDTTYCNNFTQMFANCFVTKLPKISVIAGTGLTQTFVGMRVLKEIEELNLRGQKEFDEGKTPNTFDRTFDTCAELEKITVTGIIGNSISFSNCSKLTPASVDSIIGALKQLAEGETAKTVTFHSTVKGKMTDSQKAIIQEKGWSLA